VTKVRREIFVSYLTIRSDSGSMTTRALSILKHFKVERSGSSHASL